LFENSEAFFKQKERGMIDCPLCGSVKIETKPSSFAIGGRAKKEEEEKNIPPQVSQLMRLQQHLEKNYEDVGPRFAEQALKIHYGELEEKNIRGTTTEAEEKKLKKEGVPFLKIPFVRFDS
jgi:hypothetical protein